ncbi:hypothetical protein LIER_33478 [Lithospermum erythrorhizon]|uniref:Uncharacterized protein n=1 Tax=Lithospermum erythrorhizon TaxID=34254 RepID=A0AAV3RZC2_LITER
MYQEQANTNAINRGQRKFPHMTGRTAFLEVIHELSSSGAPATQLDVWLVSRSLGKGVKDDGETADLHVHHVLALILPAHALNKDGVKVELFDDGIPKEVVSKGILVSKDPKERVANMPLDPDHWKIFLEDVVCPSYILSRSGDMVFTVGQAINSFLAWPIYIYFFFQVIDGK